MAVFVFSLEGVLRQRTHVEQQKQRELALVQTEMAAMDAALRSMDAEVKASTDDMRQNHLTGLIDLGFLAAHRRYTFAMQRKAMTLMQQMAEVQKKVELARAALSEAARGRKAIEKLRERQLLRWRETTARRETAEMDEIGMQLSFRANSDHPSAS